MNKSDPAFAVQQHRKYRGKIQSALKCPIRSDQDMGVWHDDQQGTATVLLAGLMNATRVVGKSLEEIRILLVGAGSANVAAYRLFCSYGIDPAAIVVCDSKGILHRQRADIERKLTEYADKWRICQESNSEDLRGGIEDAMRGADVCIALSAPGPGVIQPEWIRHMASQPIVFACANPMPEIMPSDALDAGVAIMATGRSDFPNQVNNSLAFPSIFRGVLDVRATRISDSMAIAAATELATVAQETGLRPNRILPSMRDTNAYVRVAVATAMQAQVEGLAREQISRDDEFTHAERMICDAQRMSALITQDFDR
jgi:malate dehydrogenase (oxaloacetate-decarboxylating)